MNTKNALLDPSFAEGGKVLLPNTITSVQSSLKTAKGRVCIGTAHVDGTSAYVVFRLDDEARLDPAFGREGLTTGTFRPENSSRGHSVLVLDDGRYLIIGTTTDGSYFGSRPALARFHDNGSLDTSFANGGHLVIEQPAVPIDLKGAQSSKVCPLTPTAKGIPQSPQAEHELQNWQVQHAVDGIYVLYTPNGWDSMLLKYDSNGELDQSFNNTGYKYLSLNFTTWTAATTLQVSEKYIVVGGTISGPEGYHRCCAIRLHHSGEYDQFFGEGGFGYFTPSLRIFKGLTLLPDGRIVSCGLEHDLGSLLAALDADGNIDTSFDSTPIHLEDGASVTWEHVDVIESAPSKIIATGVASTQSNGWPMLIGRFNSNGKLDTTFADNGTGRIALGQLTLPHSGEVDTEGRTLVHGATTLPGPSKGFILRCLTNSGG